MERTWTEVGEKALSADALEARMDGERWKPITRERIEKAIEKMRWESTEGDKPMMPALGIKECIKQLGIPKVSQIAISNDLANDVGNSYGLYGIEGHYKNGRVRVYVVDRGSDLIPVATDF